jgi:SPP1 gp7 family putative phage head morphogenesis protein
MEFTEAVDWANSRLVVLPDIYYGKLQRIERAVAFTVTGITQYEQLQSILDTLILATKNGLTFDKWKKLLLEKDLNLELPAHQLETIFRTNLQNHYNRGRCEQQNKSVKYFPYYMYSAVMDNRTRPAHAAMHGFVARFDDPIWRVWTPPCGFNCRCIRIALSPHQAAEYQKRDEQRMQSDSDFRNSRNNAILTGPDKGWDYSVCEDITRNLRNKILDLIAQNKQSKTILDKPLIATKDLKIDTPPLTDSEKNDFLAWAKQIKTPNNNYKKIGEVPDYVQNVTNSNNANLIISDTVISQSKVSNDILAEIINKLPYAYWFTNQELLVAQIYIRNDNQLNAVTLEIKNNVITAILINEIPQIDNSEEISSW